MEQKRVPLQIKSLNDREFEGYGSIFGNEDLGGDIVVKGAFTKSLKRHQKEGSLPLMFWAHDPAQVPGMWTEMSEDGRGLYVKGVLADTQLGNEVRTLLGMKAVRGLSIGFSIPPKGLDYDEDGRRLIKEAELWEVSVVSLPMNPRAQVSHAKTRLSAAGEYVPTTKELSNVKRELETWFKARGFSKAAATTYASMAFKDDEGATLKASLLEDGATPDADEVALAKRLAEVADGLTATIVNRRLKVA
jgi:phage prohead protease, HK97 family